MHPVLPIVWTTTIVRGACRPARPRPALSATWNDPESEVSKYIAEKGAQPYMPENGTTPSVYYVCPPSYRGSDAQSLPLFARGKALWYNKIADAGDRPREGREP